MNGRRLLLFIIMLSLTFSACAGGENSPTPKIDPPVPTTPHPSSTATAAASQMPKDTAAPTNAPPTARPTVTPAPTGTPTPAVTATAAKLRARVTIQQAVCHYGPGAPYLYKYGVYEGSNIELLRRVEGGNYVEMQAIGGSNPCWVRVDYFDIKGSWLDLPPVRFDEVRLPITPYYASPGGVSARREGNEVTVFWNPLLLRAGDSSEQTPYIVEAWVCQNGKNVFVPAGTHQAAVSITDEPGCPEPSYAFFIAAEKHGYTPRVEVPWPAP